MQTFYPEITFKDCARVLDNKRLGKQRVECKQILEALSYGPTSTKCYDCDRIYRLYLGSMCPWCFNPHWDWNEQVKTPWYNHPATQMWKGNINGLARYGQIMCEEWISRGFKDSLLPFSKRYAEDTLPFWYGDPEMIMAHRSNLIRKEPNHYQKLWPDVPDNLPYKWPVESVI